MCIRDRTEYVDSDTFRLVKAMEDYDKNYTIRSIADLEYRADLESSKTPLSNSPLAMLGYEQIRRKSTPSGDVGDYITHVLAEPDYKNEGMVGAFNNPKYPRRTRGGAYIPTPISNLALHGMYINTDQGEKSKERLERAGIKPGEIFVNQPSGKVSHSLGSAGVARHELGHAGADLTNTLDRASSKREEIVMRMIDRDPKYYNEDILFEPVGGGLQFAKEKEVETLRAAEKEAIKYLNLMGVPLMPKNADPDMQYGEPFFKNPREDNFIQKFSKWYNKNIRKRDSDNEINKRYRYAEGGIVSLLENQLGS